jgi:hypothetical protein
VFCVDAAWLSRDSRQVSLPQQPEPADPDEDASRERQNIEDALAGTRGRVSGPNGAAAKLRVPLRPCSTALRNYGFVKATSNSARPFLRTGEIAISTNFTKSTSSFPPFFFCLFNLLRMVRLLHLELLRDVSCGGDAR